MDHQLKNEHQKALFDLIKQKLPENLVLVDVIAGLLDINAHSVYRRIRGEKLLDFEEYMFLCNHFNIPLDLSVNGVTDKHIQCRYTPMDLRNEDNYLDYLHDLLYNLEGVRSKPDGEVVLSAVDIPLFHYGSCKELILFILFSWSSGVYGFKGKYEDFVKEYDLSETLKYYEKIVRNYQDVPSTEIWTIRTIDRLIKLLGYHSEMGHFDDEHFPFFLCEQLLELISTLEQWTEKGTKGLNGKPFKLYISEIHLSNTFILFKKNGTTNCALKLFTINHFDISDSNFCREAEQWLNNTTRQATLISGASERERHKFFSQKRKKVIALVDMMHQNRLHLSKKDYLSNFWNSFP